MERISVNLFDESANTAARMLVGYCFNMPLEENNYVDKLTATIEFMEAVMDLQFDAVATYYVLLSLLPENLVRRVPDRMTEFTTMYLGQIEEAMGGEIIKPYRPRKSVILAPDGQPASKGLELL